MFSETDAAPASCIVDYGSPDPAETIARLQTENGDLKLALKGFEYLEEEDDRGVYFDQMTDGQLAAARAEIEFSIKSIDEQLKEDRLEGCVRTDTWRIRAKDARRHLRTDLTAAIALLETRQRAAREERCLKERELAVEKDRLKTERHRITSAYQTERNNLLMTAFRRMSGDGAMADLEQAAARFFPEFPFFTSTQ